jgi:hypothetical protein
MLLNTEEQRSGQRGKEKTPALHAARRFGILSVVTPVIQKKTRIAFLMPNLRVRPRIYRWPTGPRTSLRGWAAQQLMYYIKAPLLHSITPQKVRIGRNICGANQKGLLPQEVGAGERPPFAICTIFCLFRVLIALYPSAENGSDTQMPRMPGDFFFLTCM